MNLLQNLLTIMGVTHETEQLSQVDVHHFKNLSSMHFAFVEVCPLLPRSRQLGNGSLELIASCFYVTAAFEAPVTHEGRTDDFIHSAHIFDESIQHTILHDRYNFVICLDYSVFQYWLHRELFEHVYYILDLIYCEKSLSVDEQSRKNELTIFFEQATIVDLRK